jgi:hypothetical protein
LTAQDDFEICIANKGVESRGMGRGVLIIWPTLED